MSGGIWNRLSRTFSPDPAGEERTAHQVRLIVGLGNAGGEYGANRHNAGYWVVNRLARRHGINLKASGQASFGEGRIGGRAVALAKPRSYVNRSGPPVWNLIKRLKLDGAAELLVVCDDLDLPVGRLRLRAQGGHGGHKGLRSIIEATGSDQFARLRIGIGRPSVAGQPSYDPEVIADYVLSDPPPEERQLLDEAVDRAIEAIEAALADGIEQGIATAN